MDTNSPTIPERKRIRALSFIRCIALLFAMLTLLPRNTYAGDNLSETGKLAEQGLARTQFYLGLCYYQFTEHLFPNCRIPLIDKYPAEVLATASFLNRLTRPSPASHHNLPTRHESAAIARPRGMGTGKKIPEEPI